jgi:ATP-dependent Lhr-like helicase
MDSFSLMHEGVRQVLANRLRWQELLPVQEETYREVRAGNDVLVVAPTAGGKTEAALIPVVDGILRDALEGVAALYIAPLKALINDQEERFSLFCAPNGLDLLTWHGDIPRGDRSWKEDEPPHILMITPESLEVLLTEKKLRSALKQVHYIIVDELHAFVESERGVHMRVLLDRIDRVCGRNVQRVGLSATVGNPEKILSWFGGGRQGQSLVLAPAVPKEKRFTFIVEGKDARRIRALATAISGKKALVFVNSRGEAEEVTRTLSGLVDQPLIHHSSLSPGMRKEAEEAFSRAGSACIICTSTLELGIDIGDLDVVALVGAPSSVSSFLQRMGRAGRRGKPPYVVCVLKDSLAFLCMVAVIESAREKEVEPLTPMEKPYNVLVQQILLELLRSRRSSRTAIKKFIRTLSPFLRITGRSVDTLLSSMVEAGFLEQDGDLLFLGCESERLFGQSNWKDLFSVIRGGGEFRAVTPDGEVIGKLDSRFVAGRSGKSFTLGGKSWTFIKSDQAHELAVVVPGEGERSDIFWTGGHTGLSSVVCKGIEKIISRKGSDLPLPDREHELLMDIIHQFPSLTPGALHILENPGRKGPEVTILTFRGKSWNSTLATLMRRESDRKLAILYDDFLIRVKNAAREDASKVVLSILEKLRLKSDRLLGSALTAYPGTWKFGQAIPEDLLMDMSLTDCYHLPEFAGELRAADLVTIYGPDECSGNSCFQETPPCEGEHQNGKQYQE